MTDGDLVIRYSNGDNNALDELYNKYWHSVFSVIFAIVKNEQVTKDLIQDTFLKVIKIISNRKYNEQGRFKYWIMMLARNASIDHFRATRKHPITTITDNGYCDVVAPIEDTCIGIDRSNQIKAAVDRLPPKQREVITMRYWKGMKFETISEELGIPVNTALGRSRYAINKLRKLLKR